MKEILLVHDHQENPASRKSFLEVSGYEVVLASSGDQCLARIEQKVPALILMDVLLEGPNGFEVCRKIRASYGPSELPILLSSGIYRSRIYRDEAAAVGAQGYLLKPVEPDELVREVSETLSRSGAPRQA